MLRQSLFISLLVERLSLKVSNISGLQIFQFLRFSTFFIISIIFAKTSLSEGEIGDWEYVVFITGAMSFFWVTGLIQSFLPLYKRNRAFARYHALGHTRSPELYNAFLLMLVFSGFFALMILLMNKSIPVLYKFEAIPYGLATALFFFLGQATSMIEYIYLLKDKPKHILYYGFISFGLQVVFACVPIFMGFGVEGAIWGMVAISFIKFIWLIRLLLKYASFRFSFPFIKEHLYLGYPVIIGCLLSGSAQYLDGFLAMVLFEPERFAIFRYGAKELPFVVMMTTGLSNAMIPEFSAKKNLHETLSTIRVKSLKMMHILFPLSMVFMLTSKYLFGVIFFRDAFYRSADIFMVYQLLIMSRIIFPQTILLGLKKTRVIMTSSILSILLNIPASIFFTKYYGVVGIALGSGLAYTLSKMFLAGYVWKKLKISPDKYIPVIWYLFYGALIILLFVLIDHRIIKPW